jgi:hypothetical protein
MHVWNPRCIHSSFQIVDFTVQQQQRTGTFVSMVSYGDTQLHSHRHFNRQSATKQQTRPADLAKLPPSTKRVVQSLGFSAWLAAKRANCPRERNVTHISRTTGHAWHGMAAHRIRLSRPHEP